MKQKIQQQQQWLVNLQFFAKKKGAGSTKNGRDSKPKYLGSKRGDGEMVKNGELIYLQRGTKIHPGKNVKRAHNDALFALKKGYVHFHYIRGKKRAISVRSFNNYQTHDHDS